MFCPFFYLFLSVLPLFSFNYFVLLLRILPCQPTCSPFTAFTSTESLFNRAQSFTNVLPRSKYFIAFVQNTRLCISETYSFHKGVKYRFVLDHYRIFISRAFILQGKTGLSGTGGKEGQFGGKWFTCGESGTLSEILKNLYLRLGIQ